MLRCGAWGETSLMSHICQKMDETLSSQINIFYICLVSMLIRHAVDVSAMTGLLQTQVDELGDAGTIFPSAIGRGFDAETKAKLTLFLVSP